MQNQMLEYYQLCSNNDPGLALTYFMTRSNLVPYAFAWEKVKTMTLKLGMQHRVLEYYQIYSNDDPGLTLTYFMARSILVPYAFILEKGKTMDFSETI